MEYVAKNKMGIEIRFFTICYISIWEYHKGSHIPGAS